MSNDIVRRGDTYTYTYDETLSLGKVLARSGYFQDARDEAQAVAKILAGRELGIGPLASLTSIYIVKGRVTLSANLIAGAIKRSGKYNYRVTRLENSGCTIVFTENGQEIGTSTFDDADAKAAGLGGDNWNKYRKNMHFARAMSNGAKWYTPDIFAGPIYTPDELGATVDGETGEVVETHATQPRPVITDVTADAERQFFKRYGRLIGGTDWNAVQAFLPAAQGKGKPIDAAGWQRAAQAIDAAVEADVAADYPPEPVAAETVAA